MHRLPGLLLMAVLSARLMAAEATDAPERRNWYDDPFIRVRAALPACPVPLGPWQTAAQAANEAHYRADRGTRCWQQGRCPHPNAYAGDRTIADAVRRRFDESARFARTSLWITVKRGWVFVDGCASSQRDTRALEAFLAPIPNVEKVVVNVMQGTAGRPPYAAESKAPAKRRAPRSAR